MTTDIGDGNHGPVWQGVPAGMLAGNFGVQWVTTYARTLGQRGATARLDA